MSELRHDLLTGRHVLLAPARSARPHTSRVGTQLDPTIGGGEAGCPFCSGHEAETPPELARTGDGAPDTPGWRVRVVPNLYPIVGSVEAGGGAGGAHEVVVLSPDHHRAFDALDDTQAVDVLRMIRDRVRTHASSGWPYTQVLVNQGRAAGASLAHPHAQLVALERVPPGVERALSHFGEADHDLVIGDLEDARTRDLLVLDGKAAVWCPHGSAAPYEIRIATVSTGARFADTDDADLTAVVLALRDALAALARALDDPPYNVVVHDAPAGTQHDHQHNHWDRYHWWVEIVPRVAVVAGFEMGTGLFVNTVRPEDAALALRTSD